MLTGIAIKITGYYDNISESESESESEMFYLT